MKLYRAVLLVVALALWPADAFAASQVWLRLSFIHGDVQIKTQDTVEWGPASLNTPISEGDQLWVPDEGLAELQLSSGTYIRLDQNSAFNILSLENGSSQFYLAQGHAYVFYDAPEGDIIQIDTPSNSVRARDNAVFRIDLSRDYTDVGVFDGRVLVETERGNKRVNSGQMLSLASRGGVEMGQIGEADDWENWNNKRNALISSRGDSSRYLPAEIKTYSSDLDRHGRWVRSDEYGNVWLPSDADRDWAPYKHGRWIWRGGEYVWVGFEPWGWAPYHYGRWAYLDDYGWCWVPPLRGEVYWGPGYVGWVKTDRHVAWVPLAPNETYYGRGNYGRLSVDISTRRQGDYEPPHEYAHFRRPHGVVVVEREGFASGRHTGVHIDINVFHQHARERRGFDGGAPDIRPSRGAYFAVDRHIAVEKAPPPRVREIHVIELKQHRPMVREVDQSVFRPGARAVELNVQVTAAPRRPHVEEGARVQVRPAAISDKDKAVLGEGARYERPGADKSRPLFQNRTQSQTETPAQAPYGGLKQDGAAGPDKGHGKGEPGAVPGAGQPVPGGAAPGTAGGGAPGTGQPGDGKATVPGGADAHGGRAGPAGGPAGAPAAGSGNGKATTPGSADAPGGRTGPAGGPAGAPAAGSGNGKATAPGNAHTPGGRSEPAGGPAAKPGGGKATPPGDDDGASERKGPAGSPSGSDHRSKPDDQGSRFAPPGGREGPGGRGEPAGGPGSSDRRSKSDDQGSRFAPPAGREGPSGRGEPAGGPGGSDRRSKSDDQGSRFAPPGGREEPSGRGEPAGGPGGSDRRSKSDDQGSRFAPPGGREEPGGRGGPFGGSNGSEHRSRQDDGGSRFAPQGGREGGGGRESGGGHSGPGGGGRESVGSPGGHAPGGGSGRGQERKCAGPDGSPAPCPH